MLRRDFIERALKGSAALGLTQGLASCAFEATETRIPSSVTRASREELDVELEVISGRLPSDLEGYLFIAAPLPQGDGTHIFNGDGISYRATFGDGAPRLRSRIHKTPSYFADQLAEGNLAFRSHGILRYSPRLGFRTQLNTAFTHLGSRLFLTGDVGRPWQIDPVSMDLVAPLGSLTAWEDAFDNALPDLVFPLQLSSAHPFEDMFSGEMFTVSFRAPSLGGEAWLMRQEANGGMRRWPLFDEDGQPVRIHQGVHQLAGTERFLLIADTSFFVEPGQLLGREEESLPQLPFTRVWIVDRQGLRSGSAGVTACHVDLEAEALHFVADYANPGGRIILHVGHIPGFDLSEWVRPEEDIELIGAKASAELAGLFAAPTQRGYFARYVIDGRSARIDPDRTRMDTDDRAAWGLAFQSYRSAASDGRGFCAPESLEQIFWTSGGFSTDNLTRRALELYGDRSPLDRLPLRSGRPSALFRLDARSIRVADLYRASPGTWLSSPQFLPKARTQSPLRGYLSVVALSDKATGRSSGDELWIFDSANLAQGPICRLAHPALDLPLTLHTTYLPEVVRTTPLAPMDLRSDYARRLRAAGHEITSFFDERVFPHFEREGA